MNKTERLKELFDQAGLCVSDDKAEAFVRYEEMLSETNKSLNLTAITEYDDIVIKHFIDSLAPFMNFVSRETKSETQEKNVSRETFFRDGISLADVGTGAGFPGLALKIYKPDIKLTLIDSLDKRLKFLSSVMNELQIKEAVTVHARAEDGGRDKKLRESFDVCTARAVANLSVLTEYCLPYVKTGGVFIAYKAADSDEEIKQAEAAIKILGGKLEDVLEVKLPGPEIIRRLIVIRKIKATPAKYPRKPGTPGRDPLK